MSDQTKCANNFDSSPYSIPNFSVTRKLITFPSSSQWEAWNLFGSVQLDNLSILLSPQSSDYQNIPNVLMISIHLHIQSQISL